MSSGGGQVDPSAAQRVGTDAPRDISNDLRANETTAGGVEGAVSREAGPDTAPLAQGEVRGSVDTQLGETDVSKRGTAAVQGQDLEGRRGVDDLRGRASAAPDPQSEIQRGQKLEFNERDAAVGRVGAAEEQGAEARRVAADPRAVATERAESSATQKAREQSPIDPNTPEQAVGTATSTVRDPGGAADARVDVAVEDKQREAQADVGISSTTVPKPPDKK